MNLFVPNLKKTFTLSRRFLYVTIDWIKNQIRDDALNGLFQNDVQNVPLSKIYAKYKENNMRTFGRGSSRKGKGKRLKSFRGKSVSSNDGSKTTMYATGHTFNHLKGEPLPDNTGVVMRFDPKDKMKIIGNEKKKKIKLTSLNKKNIKEFTRRVMQEFIRQSGEALGKTRVIKK